VLIEVYTDGSATVASKPGGYGYVIVINGVKDSEGNGNLPSATNNDAELEATIAGLAAAMKVIGHLPISSQGQFPHPSIGVTLISDSKVVLGWASGNYKCKQERKQPRVDILRELMRRLKANTRWLKGHSGHIWNERCDELANLGRHNLGPNDSLPSKKPKKLDKNIRTKKHEIVVEYQGVPYRVNFTSMSILPL
jgi:ribonuclease HI